MLSFSTIRFHNFKVFRLFWKNFVHCRWWCVGNILSQSQRFVSTTWTWLYEVTRSKVGLKMLLFSSKHSSWPIRIHPSPIRCLKKYLSSVAANRTPRVLVVGNSLFSKSIREARSPSALSAITSGSILGDPGAASQIRRKGATKVFKYGQKSPWVPTLTELFPKIQADAGSWLGTKNALYYCAQSANSISWVLFVSSYTTAITACLAHAQKNARSQETFSLI